jgi:hypothetical protein
MVLSIQERESLLVPHVPPQPYRIMARGVTWLGRALFCHVDSKSTTQQFAPGLLSHKIHEFRSGPR